MLREIAPAVIADHEQTRGRMLGQQRFGLADDVEVVAARQPLVRGDDETAEDAVRVRRQHVRVDVRAVRVLDRAEDALDFRLQRAEVGARLVQLGLGAAHFGRGDQIHRLGDLMRFFDADDMVPNLFCGRHTLTSAPRTPCSSARARQSCPSAPPSAPCPP